MRKPNVRGYTCGVEGCDRPGYSKGMCSLHYDRLRRTGTTDDPQPRAVHEGPCSVAGCERPYLCKGFCRLHWERQHRTGTTADPEPLTGPRNPAWKGAEAGYAAIHQRMYAWPRPPACEGCGMEEGRFEWALKQGIPESRLLRSAEGYAYSLYPADYSSLCKPCHNQLDLGRDHCRQGHPLSGDNLYVQPSNGRRFCRACQTTRRRERTRKEREVI